MPDSGESKKASGQNRRPFLNAVNERGRGSCLYRGGVDPGGQLLIQQIEPALGIAAELLHLGDEIPGALFLLGLLIDEPVQEAQVR